MTQHTPDSQQDVRSAEVRRTSLGRYEATNPRGGTISVGTGEDADFTPVELLLTAIAACSSVDVDHIVSKRAEPSRLVATAAAQKVRDADGNHLVHPTVSFDAEFGDGEGGDRARATLPEAVRASHTRLCTVSRTVELGPAIQFSPSGTGDPVQPLW